MALTVNNYCGFETGGAEEALSVSASPTYLTTDPRSGSRHLSLDASDVYVLPGKPTGITDAGNNYILTFFLKAVDQTPTAATNVITVETTGDRLCWHLEAQTDGTFTLLDSKSATIRSSITGPSSSVYTRYDVYFEISTTGVIEVVVDGVSQGSDSAQDLLFSGTEDGVDKTTFTGPTGIVSPWRIDDVLLLSGATAVTDRFSDVEVYAYQNNQGASTASDGGLASVGTSGGDNAANNWDRCAETPLDNSVATSFTASGVAGSVDLTGPSGDANIDGDSNIKAVKGVWNLSRGNGGSSTHYIGLGDSGDTDVADQTVSLTNTFANFEWLRETNLPTASQFIRQGFGTSGARDINCGDMWAMLLHVPTVTADITRDPAKADLTITGFAPTCQINVLAPNADLTVTGFAPTTQISTNLSPAKADLTVTGFAPAFKLDVQLVPAAATITIASFAATTQLDVSVAKADLTIAGFAPSTQVALSLSPTQANLTVVGFAPTTQIRTTPAFASLVATSFAPTAQQVSQRLPAKGDLTLTPFAATTQLNVAGVKADLTITGFTPRKESPRLPAKADLTITGFAPTTAADIDALPAKADLTVTGFAPALSESIVSPAATLTITGFAATVQIRTTPAFAPLTVTGFAPTTQLRTSPPKADLVITGFEPSLTGVITPATASLTINGFAATTQTNTSVPKADLTIAGFAATVQVRTTPAAASLIVTGFSPALNESIVPAAAALNVAGFVPTTQVRTTPAKADLTIAGFAPVRTVSIIAAPAKVDLTVTGFAPTTQVITSVPAATLTVTGFAATAQLNVAGVAATLTIAPSTPTCQISINLAPASATLTIAGFAATTQVRTTPAVASLTIAGFAPTLSAPINLTPAQADLVITGFAPIASTGLNINRLPAFASLVLAGQVPGENIIEVGKNDLTVTGFAAECRTGSERFPAAGSLIATGFAPTLFVTERVYANPPVATLLNIELANKRPTIQIDTRVAAQAALTITGNVASAGIGFVKKAALLTLTTFAPSLPNRKPAHVDLTLTTFAPTVRIDTAVANADLTITGFAPQYNAEPAAAELILTPFTPVRVNETRRFPAHAALTITAYQPDCTSGRHQPAAQLILQGQFAECTVGTAWKADDAVTGVWLTEFTLCDGVRDETIAEALADVDEC